MAKLPTKAEIDLTTLTGVFTVNKILRRLGPHIVWRDGTDFPSRM